MNPALRACLRARRAWEKAGRPGSVSQLELLPGRYYRAEVERGRLADRRRR